MQKTGFIVACATAAALAAFAVQGCKYSTNASPLPGPSLSPTFPPGAVVEYPVPTANATPFGITEGLDGHIWFTELNGNNIGRSTTQGVIDEHPIPTGAAGAEDISQGSGNPNIWFVETNASKIGFINPSTLVISEISLAQGAGPTGLAPDALGNLWFGEFNAGKIGQITAGGIVTEYPIGFSGSQPVAVAVTPDNTVWFLDFFNNAVGHLTFPGGNPTFAEFPIPTGSNSPEDIIVGPDQNLWFTEAGNFSLGQGSRIGQFNVSTNTITEFLVPTQSIVAGAFGLTVGPDNNIWFAETEAGQIARLKTSGPTITEWGIPGSGTTAIDVSKGPAGDGGLWFTDGGLVSGSSTGTNQIGRVNIAALPASGIRKQYTARTEKFKVFPLMPIHGPRLFVRIK